MVERTYTGEALDHSWQYWDERPAASETVYATDPEPAGEVTTEGVPVPDGGERPVDAEGQTTIADWAGGD